MHPVEPWVEWLVGGLLVFSGLLALIAAWGLVRFPDFYRRMHPPALVSTLGTWAAAGATIVYLSVLEQRIDLNPWLLVILLAMTVPITAVLLARAALLRHRSSGKSGTPPPLLPRGDDPDASGGGV